MPRPTTSPETLLARTTEDPITGCLIWQGYTNPDGWPVAQVNYKRVYVARYLWLTFRDAKSEDHGYLKSTCGRRLCINPEHMREA